jgi:hypothetical protein
VNESMRNKIRKEYFFPSIVSIYSHKLYDGRNMNVKGISDKGLEGNEENIFGN